MDDQTGKFYGFKDKETMDIFEERFRQFGVNMIPVQKLPDPGCKKCGGKGSRKSYFANGETRRYVPCECVK